MRLISDPSDVCFRTPYKGFSSFNFPDVNTVNLFFSGSALINSSSNHIVSKQSSDDDDQVNAAE